MRKVAVVLRANAEELAMLDAANCGNPIREMLKDVAVAAMQIEFYAGLMTEAKGETIPMGDGIVVSKDMQQEETAEAELSPEEAAETTTEKATDPAAFATEETVEGQKKKPRRRRRGRHKKAAPETPASEGDSTEKGQDNNGESL